MAKKKSRAKKEVNVRLEHSLRPFCIEDAIHDGINATVHQHLSEQIINLEQRVDDLEKMLKQMSMQLKALKATHGRQAQVKASQKVPEATAKQKNLGTQRTTKRRLSKSERKKQRERMFHEEVNRRREGQRRIEPDSLNRERASRNPVLVTSNRGKRGR